MKSVLGGLSMSRLGAGQKRTSGSSPQGRTRRILVSLTFGAILLLLFVTVRSAVLLFNEGHFPQTPKPQLSSSNDCPMEMVSADATVTLLQRQQYVQHAWRRQLVDLSAIQQGFTTAPPPSGPRMRSAGQQPYHVILSPLPPLLPRKIFQYGPRHQVPIQMKHAIDTLRTEYLAYDHRYYADAEVLPWIQTEFNKKSTEEKTFRALISDESRQQMFMWLKLNQDGGVFLGNHLASSLDLTPEPWRDPSSPVVFSASGKRKEGNAKAGAKKKNSRRSAIGVSSSHPPLVFDPPRIEQVLDLYRPDISVGDEVLVAAVDGKGTVDTSFVGSTANSYVLSEVFSRIKETVASGARSAGYKIPSDPLNVTGARVFTEAIRGVVDVPWEVRAKKKKKMKKSAPVGGSSSTGKAISIITASPSGKEEMERVPSKLAEGLYRYKQGVLDSDGRQRHGVVILVKFDKKRQCYSGIIEATVQPKQHSSRGGKAKSRMEERSVLPLVKLDRPVTLFYTRYPGHHLDQLWYRLEDDDYIDMFEKTTLFNVEPECFSTTSKLIWNRFANVQTNRRRILLDIAAHTPARELPPQQVPPGGEEEEGMANTDTGGVEEEKRRNEQKIPRIIMQTNKADRIPSDMRNYIQGLLDLNPEYQHYYFSDARIRDFIKQHFDQRTLDAFDAVIPGAYKSDLFRYCFLYIKGGVYLDTDFVAVRPLRFLIGPSVEFLSAEDCSSGNIHNAFLAATPGHPLMKRAIEVAVQRISDRQYGDGPLWITGPKMLSEVWRESGLPTPMANEHYDGNYHLVAYHCDLLCGGQIQDRESTTYFLGPYPTYKAEMRWYGSKTFLYATAYKARKVYVGERDSDTGKT